MARIWQLRNESWFLPAQGAIMGILNITPDSFSDGGLHYSRKAALAHAHRLIEEGADIIDIGGESSRPGADPVPIRTEQRRVLPIISFLREKYPTLRISVDTRRADTARKALEAGADIINDISGLTNPEMRHLCAEQPCGIVLMHVKGSIFGPKTAPTYCNVVSEVRRFFEEQLALAEAEGISLSRICLDPGIGFNKNTQNNLDLIHGLEDVRVRNLPLLMGLSRKRFLNDLAKPPLPNSLDLDLSSFPKKPEPADEKNPTIGMSMLAADNGADIHRVHDVAPHLHALRLRHAAIVNPNLYPQR